MEINDNVLRRLAERIVDALRFEGRISKALEKEMSELEGMFDSAFPEVLENGSAPAKIVFYRGDIDCLGISFGAAIYDIMNPPWAPVDREESTIHGVPNSVYLMSESWERIFARRV